jgi:uncharacterized protein (AIM24 family)
MGANDKAIESWSVDDVVEWLTGIGLGHKVDAFREKAIDGKQLLGTPPEEWKKTLGLSNLQVRKIQRELESEKAKTVVPGVARAILIEGNGDLQKQVNELASLLNSLKSDMNMIKNQSTEVARDPSPNATQTSVKLPFCTEAVIHGNQTQVLTVLLGPNDVVRAEPGSMLHMSDWINCRTKTFGQGFGRLFTGNTIFQAEYFYEGPAGTADTVTFSPDFPGQIIPVRLEDYSGGKIICQKGSLLASANTVNLSVEFTQHLGAALFAGNGFLLQGLTGTGYAFLNARGVVIKKHLRAGERWKVDTGALVGFENGVDYRVEEVMGLSNVFFSGQGLFNICLTGPGHIWIESQPQARLIKRIMEAVKAES